MGELLEAWCDRLTTVMQNILYTIEQDVHHQLIEKGKPLISLIALMSSDPELLERFQSNPCEVLKDLIPMMRQNPQASEIVREIFASDNANAQRTAMVEEMRRRIVDCVGFAVGFTENWIETRCFCITYVYLYVTM